MHGGCPILEQLNLRDAAAVAAVLHAGANAARNAACRRGCADVVCFAPDEPALLIATGDLHDHPLHLARLVHAAGLAEIPPARSSAIRKHLVLHELIHPDRLSNGLDYSYRVLARIAALKVAYPEHVHVLLANHEIAQATGGRVAKDGVDCVAAFDEAIDVAFGDDAPLVRDAAKAFMLSFSLFARFEAGPGFPRVVVAHSLPAEELMDRFDTSVLTRELTPDDFVPRRGAAHLLTWGRDLAPAHLASLGTLFAADLFVLGHEKCEDGWMIIQPASSAAAGALVLNSDHSRGVYVPVDLRASLSLQELAWSSVRLSDE